MSDVPLPEPAYYQWRRKNMPWSLEFAFSHMCHATTEDSEIRTLHTADQMHQYATAVSAADNDRLSDRVHMLVSEVSKAAADNAALRSLVHLLDALMVDLDCECIPPLDKAEYRAAIRAALGSQP